MFSYVFCGQFSVNGLQSTLPHKLENSSTQNTKLIIYFIIASMNLFEVEMFNLVTNINCRHLTAGRKNFVAIFSQGHVLRP